MHSLQYSKLVLNALQEDLSHGDITTDSIFSDEVGKAAIVSREAGIAAGLEVAKEVFLQVEPALKIDTVLTDGLKMNAGTCLMTITGPVSGILKAERTALNFLQRMCGIATAAHLAVQKVKGTHAKIVDTRKTTPGLRVLEKYAVRMGGADNHRFHLGDMVMIKDNHITGAASITEAVKRVRQKAGFALKIEVEASTLADVEEALQCQADIIMLDNMSTSEMADAVKRVKGKALLEASGGITIEKLPEIAQTGVDLISLGYLTHHNRSLDLSLLLQR